VEYHTGVFQELYRLKVFEYLPFFLLLFFDFAKQRSLSTRHTFMHAGNFSVLIPTLNESENISGALDSIRKQKGVLETIVVDGGSTDGTVESAGNLGAQVVVSEPGRGFQISAGSDRCRGDMIFILHADCQLVPGTFERIKEELKRNPHCIGGALGMCYVKKSFKNRFLTFLNNLRSRWTGISFGDQGQFFRREALSLMEGFPKQMLMEDVELSLRLKDNGAVCHIPNGIMVSNRRWDEMGFFANFMKVVTLCLAYLIKRRIGIGDARIEGFYNRYYADKNINLG
jgi:rSAM/selenodomain-associated transferase 2